jgi:hypothetical protein
MKSRVLIMSMALMGCLQMVATPAETKDPSKAALQAFNEYIGQWKGTGEAKGGKDATWKESADWSWKIKGADSALVLKLTGSKQFTEGTLRYLADKKKYEFIALNADKKEMVFVGEIKAKRLVLTYSDPDTKDKTTIEMSTNNDGARFIYNVAVQKKGVGLAKKVAEVGLTKEGVSLAGGKKNECIVTGGLGTMAVSFKGKTYYVCCSGCRDEFNAAPEKYIAEYEKNKK